MILQAPSISCTKAAKTPPRLPLPAPCTPIDTSYRPLSLAIGVCLSHILATADLTPYRSTAGASWTSLFSSAAPPLLYSPCSFPGHRHRTSIDDHWQSGSLGLSSAAGGSFFSLRSFPSSGLPISSRASSKSGRTVLPQLQPPSTSPSHHLLFFFYNFDLFINQAFAIAQTTVAAFCTTVRLSRAHCSVESQGRPVVAKAAVTHLSTSAVFRPA